MSRATVRDTRAIRESASGMAILVTDGGDFEEWIAKSMIHEDSEVFEDGHEGDLVLKPWLAEKLGIELD